LNAKRRAVVIGAGPAGLTAAYQLLKELPGCEVTVFEETDRIGGISATIEYHGNRIDIGGHRFFSKSKTVNELWQVLCPIQGKPAKDDLLLQAKKEFALSGPDPEQEDRVMLIRRRVSRIFYRRRFFDYPISIKGSTFINMGLSNTIKAGFSYIYSNIKKRPENSLEDFYINRFGKQLYKLFFEDYTEKVWGVHPSKLSASWGAQRVKELSILGILKDALLKIFVRDYKTNSASLIENFIYPKKGPGQLWEIMAEKVRELGGSIIFNARVSGIARKEGFVTSVSIERNGEIENVSCDYLFSSMPVKDLIAAMNASDTADNPVPHAVQKIAMELPYRDFITAGLLVRKLKLKNSTRLATVSNIVPDCWIYIQERDVKIGRLQIFNNWSPYMVSDLEHTIWLGLEYFCNEGDELWSMSREAFIDFAVEELVKINIIEKDDVLDAEQVKIKKTYPAYFGSYSEFDTVRAFLDRIENLYCIGRNGQHRYNNMDHSMLTAIEAVNLVKTGTAHKSAVWNVNTDEEYHEKK
jgi:protoporphyrinogen oxidase